jgi:hypothetical protein
MKVQLTRHHGTSVGWCKVIQEGGDAPIKDESHLMYQIKKILIEQGHDVIKKEMVKDGHLTSEGKYYVRSRKWKKPDSFAIFDESFDVRFAHKDLKEHGSVTFKIIYNLQKE